MYINVTSQWLVVASDRLLCLWVVVPLDILQAAAFHSEDLFVVGLLVKMQNYRAYSYHCVLSDDLAVNKVILLQHAERMKQR
jgi:hypothetical protein